MPFGETIVALATPVGESALALIRLSGPLCQQIATDAFKRSCPPLPRQAYVGGYTSHDGQLLDECVYTLYADGHSFTGEALLEISIHGNPLIAQNVIEDAIHRGCRMAEPGEFSRTAFHNGKLDLSQAEAIADLISARSQQALRTAQQQMAGAIGSRMNQLTDHLLQAIAELEAYIDFPEEDLPDEQQSGPMRALTQIIDELAELIATSRYRSVLKDGIKTIIVGAPNAGKSSLLNALLGDDRAIVSPEPGTTRDFIAEKIMLGPYCIQVIDTAGLHSTEETIERIGIAKTLQKIEEADFYLVVVDRSQPPPLMPETALAHLQPQNTLVIENKIDLPCPPDFPALLPECPRVQLSLKTLEGLDRLRTKLIATLESEKIVPNEDALIINARHATALRKARAHIESAVSMLLGAESAELAVSELRVALEAFGDVVGKVDNEQMLDKLFASFCIGK